MQGNHRKQRLTFPNQSPAHLRSSFIWSLWATAKRCVSTSEPSIAPHMALHQGDASPETTYRHHGFQTCLQRALCPTEQWLVHLPGDSNSAGSHDCTSMQRKQDLSPSYISHAQVIRVKSQAHSTSANTHLNSLKWFFNLLFQDSSGMQYLLKKAWKYDAVLSTGYTLISPPCLHSSTGIRSIVKKKTCLFCQLTLQMLSFCACHYLEVGNLTVLKRIVLLFLFPLSSLSKHAAMPKPLCNLEGIFLLPQGQHVFFPGSPIAQAVQSARKHKSDMPRMKGLVTGNQKGFQAIRTARTSNTK